MIGKAVYGILSTTAGVTAIVSTRIYPHDVPPQIVPTYPLVVYKPDVSVPIDNDHSSSASLYRCDVDIAVIATSESSAASAGAAIRTALHNQTGTWGTIDVRLARISEGSEDSYQLLGVDAQRHVWQAQCTFWHR